MIPAMDASFTHAMHEISQRGRLDPAGAFAACGDLLAKTSSPAGVLHLAQAVMPLACAGLNQPQRAAEFIDRCLAHPAAAEAQTARGLHRCLSVVAELRRDLGTAAHERALGIGTPADDCRLAVLAAQLFVACNRRSEALHHLRRAAALVRDLPPGDAAAAVVESVAAEIADAAQTQARDLHALVEAAAAANLAATNRHADWRQRHLAWHHYGLALLTSGQPTKALAAVARLIELENLHASGPAQRFLSANLACRAQAMRGQFRIAAQAGEACRAFAAAAMREGAVPADLGPALDDLERYVAGLKPG